MRLEDSSLLDCDARIDSEDVPRRPRLTILLVCSLVFWLTCALAYSQGMYVEVEVCLNAAAVCLIAALLLIVLRILKAWEARGNALMIALSMLVATSFGLFEAVSMHLLEGESFSIPGQVRLIAIEDLVGSDGNYKILASVELEAGGRVIVEASFDDDPGLVLAGERIEASVSIRGLSEYTDYSWSKGFVGQTTVYSFDRIEQRGLRGLVLGVRREAVELFAKYGGSQAGILQALVCGYRGGIEASGEYEDYKIIGLAHVIAVSGSHLALIALVVNIAARAIGVPARIRTALVIALIALYFVFSGCTISALRAAVMASVSMLSMYAKRRSSAQNALGICLIGLILMDPRSSVSLSLALSAGSTLGLILFTRLVQHWFGAVGRACGYLIVEPVSLTLASGLTTQLYSVALFSQFSVVSVFANLVAAPLFSLACVVGLASALASVFIGDCAPLLISLSAVLVTPMQLACEILSSIPWASVPVNLPEWVALALTLAVCSSLYFVWPDRALALRGVLSIAFVAFASLAAGYVWQWQQDELIMLDVGQGDAFVLRSEGAAVLVDTGNRSSMLRDALGRNFVTRLDSVMVTHADDDHCGVLVDLSYMVHIPHVGVSSNAQVCGCEQCADLLADVNDMRGKPDIYTLIPGDFMRVGNFRIEIVWPYDYSDEGGNEDSLCLLVEHVPTGGLALLTGDAEFEQLSEIISRERIGEIEVLKIGHHGSSGSIDEETISCLSPEISLISVGKGNWYGHPDNAVLDLLEQVGSLVLRTDENGDVRVRFGAEGLRVLTQL